MSARQEAAGLLGEIDQDRAGLEHRKRLAAVGGRMVDDRRNAVVRADREKFRLELLAGADVDRNEVIGKPSSSSMIEIFQPFGVGA